MGKERSSDTEEGKFNSVPEAQRRWLWTGVCFRKTGVFLSKDTSLCEGMEIGESSLIGTARGSSCVRGE